jgi:Uma2 family endonuclease
MHMALTSKRWTRADLDRLPEDGNRYELVDGELFVVAPPSLRHERILKSIGRRLDPFVRLHALGDVYDGNPCFARGEDQVEPDLIITTTPFPLPDKWDDMPVPSLVVEVLSTSTARHDRVTKRGLYLRSGIPEYWVVDGKARAVHVVKQTIEYTTADRLIWTPPGCAESLELDLRGIFAEALGDTVNDANTTIDNTD